MTPLARTLMAAIVGSTVLAASLPTAAFADRGTVDLNVEGNGSKIKLKQKKGKKGNRIVGHVFGDNHNIDVAQGGNNGTVGVLAVGKGAKIKQRQTRDDDLDVRVGIGFD